MPLYFGAARRPLYGAYHPARPDASRPPKGVVLCGPFGREYQYAHRTLVQLARLLADAGVHAFRFDYSGTGDSAGSEEDARLDLWLEDIAEAAEELAIQADLDSVSLLGLRLGALLAVAAATRTVMVEVDEIILWNPVVSGRDWIAHQIRSHRRRFHGVTETPDGDVEVMGYLLPGDLRRALQAMDLCELHGLGDRPLTLVGHPRIPEHARLMQHLEASGATLRFLDNGSAQDWNRLDHLGEALLPRRVLEDIVDAMVNP